MSKLVSFSGLEDSVKNVTNAFKQNVKPVDVAIGASLQRGIGPLIQAQVLDRLFKNVAADSPLRNVNLQRFLQGLVISLGAALFYKGKGRAPGIIVGSLGLPAVDWLGQKLGEISTQAIGPTSGYVEYSMLTKDDAYGMLTRDSAYGWASPRRDPNGRDMARLQADSETSDRLAALGDSESEYL